MIDDRFAHGQTTEATARRVAEAAVGIDPDHNAPGARGVAASHRQAAAQIVGQQTGAGRDAERASGQQRIEVGHRGTNWLARSAQVHGFQNGRLAQRVDRLQAGIDAPGRIGTLELKRELSPLPHRGARVVRLPDNAFGPAAVRDRPARRRDQTGNRGRRRNGDRQLVDGPIHSDRPVERQHVGVQAAGAVVRNGGINRSLWAGIQRQRDVGHRRSQPAAVGGDQVQHVRPGRQRRAVDLLQPLGAERKIVIHEIA